MSNIPLQAIDLVKQFEGCILTRYNDAVGNPTIGYGHLCKANDNLFEISEEEADNLLYHDLEIASNAVQRLITITLNDNQFAALLDFTYNLGAGILQASTLRSVINRGDFEDADIQFKRWKYAGARILSGLVKRREAEAELFLM